MAKRRREVARLERDAILALRRLAEAYRRLAGELEEAGDGKDLVAFGPPGGAPAVAADWAGRTAELAAVQGDELAPAQVLLGGQLVEAERLAVARHRAQA